MASVSSETVAAHLKLYPDVPAKRRSTILRDLLLVGLVVLFAWMGVKVHDVVNGMAVLGSGVKHAGLSVESGFGSAASAVQGIPLVGGSLAGALEKAGREAAGTSPCSDSRARTRCTSWR
jgi:hypothetical protein